MGGVDLGGWVEAGGKGSQCPSRCASPTPREASEQAKRSQAGEQYSHREPRTPTRQPGSPALTLQIPLLGHLGPLLPLAEGFLLTSRPSVAGMGTQSEAILSQ